MFCSKIFLEWAPNIHLLGTLTITYTIVYRKQALFPIYIYVLLNGIYAGFAVWWFPYLYVWAILWGIIMVLPRKMPKAIALPVYMIVCGLHGLAFGTLYAPVQALFYGLSFKGMLAWIVSGFPFDLIHGLGNFAAGTLIIPFVSLLKKLESGFPD